MKNFKAGTVTRPTGKLNMRTWIGGQKGFTLVEIVMVIVILGVIGAFTFQFVAHGVLAFKKTSARKDLYDQGRLALERMVRELRDGKEITDCSSNSITFKKAHPAQAADNIEEVKYEFDDTNYLLKRVADPNSNEGGPYEAILASNVTSFQVGEDGGGGTFAVDNASSGTTASDTASSMTVSHATGSGSDRLMLVGISYNNSGDETVTGVTYNGTALTQVGERNNLDDAQVYIYSLVAPESGTHNVVINFSSALDEGAIAGVMTFTGVDQSTPLGTFASSTGDDSTPATVNISSASGELVFGVVSSEYEALTASSGQNQHWNMSISGEGTNGAGGTDAGAPTVPMSWSLDPSYNHWAIGGVSIKPSGSGSTPCEVGGVTTVFSDNFEDGVITGWSKVSGDDMVESGGVFGAPGNNTSHYTVDSGSGWTDYSFEVDAVANDDDFVGITFRVEDSDSFYVLDQRFGQDGNWNLRLRLNNNGSWSTLASADNSGQVNSQTTWYNFKVEVSGTNIKAYVDDVLKFDIDDSTLSGGTVGLWLEWSGGTDFDNAIVEAAGGDSLELVPLGLTLQDPNDSGNTVSMRTKVYLRNMP
jgi:prepilin-type N-terminal cleavage/methylation domain-containing protein